VTTRRRFIAFLGAGGAACLIGAKTGAASKGRARPEIETPDGSERILVFRWTWAPGVRGDAFWLTRARYEHLRRSGHAIHELQWSRPVSAGEILQGFLSLRR